jgi:mono/diheme cytochrome c family protein
LIRIKLKSLHTAFHRSVNGREDAMSLFQGVLVGIAFCATPTWAADVERGRDIAEHQCAACHQVAPHQRNELADAPPFELIGRKNGFDAAALAFALLEPHPKMNFSPSQRDAADVAAYISKLAR